MNDYIIAVLTKNGRINCYGFLSGLNDLYPEGLESNVIDIELATKFLVAVTDDGRIQHRDQGYFTLLNEYKHPVGFSLFLQSIDLFVEKDYDYLPESSLRFNGRVPRQGRRFLLSSCGSQYLY